MEIINKTILIDGAVLKIKFKVFPEHYSTTTKAFTYEIQFIPIHPITEKKAKRILLKLNLKIVRIWSEDVFEFTKYNLSNKNTIQKIEYVYKGERVRLVNIILITN